MLRWPASPVIDAVRTAPQRTSSVTGRGLLAVLLAGLVCASVTGCAVAPLSTPEQARATRIYHPAIDMDGRLTVQYQQQGQQVLNGSFTWNQRPEQTVVTLLSPFGQVVARITLAPGRAVFERGGQPQQVATDADQLAAQALGWPLPVAGLQAWLQGFPSAAGAPVAASAQGPTAISSSDGWRIVYATWAPDESGRGSRPRRIDLARHTEQAGDVSIRIVIDNWQPLAAQATALATPAAQ